MIQRTIPVLHMTNVDETIAFYRGQLGFQVEFRQPPDGKGAEPSFLGVSRDDALLYLSSHAGDGVAGNVVFMLCDDVDSLHCEFVANKVRIHLAPVDQAWGLRELYVLDPDGNSVRFGAPLAAA